MYSKYLKELSPEGLVTVLYNPIYSIADKTHAAELFGRCNAPTEFKIEILKNLLNHQDNIVKEGALLGLDFVAFELIDKKDIRLINKLKRIFKKIIKESESQALVATAKDCLYTLNL